MGERWPKDVDLVARPGDGPVPIVLMGKPGELTGWLHLSNPTGERAVLRQARLHGPLTGHAEMPVIMQPGQSAHVAITVAVDPGTPPGEHHVELEVGGRRYPAVAHVAEVVALEISPSPVVVENHPGETVVKQVLFRNAGNVALTVGDVGPVVLEEELLECRTGRAALDKVDTDRGGLREYFDLLVRENQIAVRKSAVLRVRNRAGSATLAPGEVRRLDLEVTVPQSIDRRTRHRGALALFTDDLTFLVVPAPRAAEPPPVAEAAPPAPRRTKGAAKSAKATPPRATKPKPTQTP